MDTKKREEEEIRKMLAWVDHRVGHRPPWPKSPDEHVHTVEEESD